MTDRQDAQMYHVATVTIAPHWAQTVRRALDIFMAKNPRATEAQALDQLLVQGAMHVVKAAERVTP